MHLSGLRSASVAALFALAGLASPAAGPALGCDDDGTQVFSAPAMELAYGGSCGGVPQQAVVVQQAPAVVYRQAAPVVVQQAPAVVYRQAAPVVVRGAAPIGYGGSAGLAGGGGIAAGRNVRIRKSTVSGLGSGGVISAGRNVKIRKSNVGF